jgi:hypothetical protein
MPKQNKTKQATITELCELMKAAKENGLTKIKLGDFEAELSAPQPQILDLSTLPTAPGSVDIPHPSDFGQLSESSWEQLGFAPTAKLKKPDEKPEIEVDPIDAGLFGQERDGSPSKGN